MSIRKYPVDESRMRSLLIDCRYYAGLGAVGNFHDSLIQFAYERQVSCDPGNSSYYLECLDGIAEGRKSEDLKFARSLLGADKDSHGAKLKLNKIVREIDNCIALLNK